MDAFSVFIVYIISGVIFGFVTKYIANSKGYDGGFAWGFWLGIIGVLVVGFRPTIEQSSAQTEYKPMYLGKQPKLQWECGCGAKNPDSINYCLSCRRTRGEYPPTERVYCPHCGANNKVSNGLCFACSKPLKTFEEKHSEGAIKSEKQTIDYASILEKLSQLHEQGVLTDEEFQQKKKDILAKI